MEVIRNSNNKTRRYQRTNGIMAAIALIVLGLLFLGRNLGYVDTQTFRIFVSWQMLLIVIGLWSMVRRQNSSGLILLAIGTFFLIPRLTGWIDGGWIRTYWPVLLIAIGAILIIRKMLPQNNRRHNKRNGFRESSQTENGYLHSDTMFGSVKHIILDPVFKGADIKNSFAGTIIDLRATKLDAGETYINVDSLFGGIELYVPNSWHVVSEVRPVFGGYNDKRFNRIEVDYQHKLIIKGNITFSGVEVKS